jgi:hypothetical protein
LRKNNPINNLIILLNTLLITVNFSFVSNYFKSFLKYEEDFEEEQNLVARLVHHLACPNSEGQNRVLLAARRHFGQGGPKRLRHTLAPLIFAGLQLVRQLHAQPAETEGS